MILDFIILAVCALTCGCAIRAWIEQRAVIRLLEAENEDLRKRAKTAYGMLNSEIAKTRSLKERMK